MQMLATGYKLIPNYRGLTGSPGRGVQSPSHRSAAFIARVRKETEAAKKLGEQQLIQAYDALRERVAAGEQLLSADIVCKCFALATEALRRATGMVYYDVQLAGGFALAAGTIAEIQTGEGLSLIHI